MTGRPFTGAASILFDLDGTLTQSAPGILASIRHALTSVGSPAPDAEQLKAFIGPPIVDSLRDVRGVWPPRRRRL